MKLNELFKQTSLRVQRSPNAKECHPNGDSPRTIHIHAQEDWILKGWTVPTDEKEAQPQQSELHMRPGVYSFEFPPHSPNLTLIIIDPDPGGWE
jgi:hypothetical protein